MPLLRLTWGERETRVLLEIWKRDEIQAMLTGGKRDRYAYMEIAKRLAGRGIAHFNAEYVRTRLKYLRKQYRQCKGTASEHEFIYFDLMDDVMKDKVFPSKNKDASSVSTTSDTVTWDSLCEQIKQYGARNGEQLIIISCSKNSSHEFCKFQVDGFPHLKHAVVENLSTIEANLLREQNSSADNNEDNSDLSIGGQRFGQTGESCSGQFDGEVSSVNLKESEDVKHVIAGESVEEKVHDGITVVTTGRGLGTDSSCEEESHAKGLPDDRSMDANSRDQWDDEQNRKGSDQMETLEMDGSNLSAADEERNSLLDEKGIIDPVQKYKCQICDEIFDSVNTYSSHVFALSCKPVERSRMQLVPVVFGCKVCGRIFESKDELNEHRKVHTVEQACVCKVCGMVLSCEERLVIHMRTKHGRNQKLRPRRKESPIICDVCGKSFMSKRSLKHHTHLHTGKPFPCKVCGKRFMQRTQLVNHERLHSGERPFVCPQCGKGFRNVSCLNVHIKVHTGEKRYPCPMCDKKFRRSGDMKQHLRSHTGERPYQCPFCVYRSSMKKTLTKHVRAVHKDECKP